MSPEPSVAGIEILAAARQVGEIELIATRIKRLLVDGHARPGEIAVVFRSPQAVGGLVGEVFGRLGLPVVFESGQALDRSPALRALAALAQLDLDDWPFEQLLAVLGSNYFQPGWPEWREGRAAVYVERTIRRLQIPRGRAPLLRQFAASGSGSPGQSTGGDAARQMALAIAQDLANALDALPQRATLPEWAHAWQRLAAGDGATAGGTIGGNRHRRLINRRAWDRLMEVLAAADTLAAWQNRPAAKLDRPRGRRNAAGYPPQRTRGTRGRRVGLRARARRPASARFAFHICFWRDFRKRSFRRPDPRTGFTARPSTGG